MKEKIGLGIITYNREAFFEKCISSIPKDKVDELVIVNDGSPYTDLITHNIHTIQHYTNKGVGVSKNDAMRYLLEKGCTHIFLIEDDIAIKDSNVFEAYINTAKATGLWHLMFGYHGPANKAGKQNTPRVVIDYGDGIQVALNHHCVGAFCYYHKGVLKNIGLMDEKFLNAFEHVEHTHQIIKAGLLPAFWWFPDIADSCKYLDEQACSEDNSSIRPRPDWRSNIEKAFDYYIQKHGVSPLHTPDTSREEVLKLLKTIKKTYSII